MAVISGGLSTAEKLSSLNPAVRREGERERTQFFGTSSAEFGQVSPTGRVEKTPSQISKEFFPEKSEQLQEPTAAPREEPSRFIRSVGVAPTAEERATLPSVTVTPARFEPSVVGEIRAAPEPTIREKLRRKVAKKFPTLAGEQLLLSGVLAPKEVVKRVPEILSKAEFSSIEILGKPVGKRIKTFKAQQLKVLSDPRIPSVIKRGAVGGVILAKAAEEITERPLQTAVLFAVPEVLAVAGIGAKLVAGRATINLAKLGLASPKVVRGAIKATEITGKLALGGLTAGFVGEKAVRFAKEPTEAGRLEILAETGLEVGFVGSGAIGRELLLARQVRLPSKRLGEIFEARVGVFPETGAVTVAASRFASRVNIEFAESIGKLGLKLSRAGVDISPKRGVPFGEVSGVTPPEAKVLQKFFVKPERFVKGSVAQATFLDKPLAKEFLEARGGRFKDIDIAIKGKERPRVPVALDVKALEEAQRITGARKPQVTPTGVAVQAFQEQSLRKALGAFQLRRKAVTGKQEFGRLEKDVRDLLFSARQAQKEGVRGVGKLITKVEKGRKKITIPLEETKILVKPKPGKIPKLDTLLEPSLPSRVKPTRRIPSLISKPSRTKGAQISRPSIQPKVSSVVPSLKPPKISEVPSIVPKIPIIKVPPPSKVPSRAPSISSLIGRPPSTLPSLTPSVPSLVSPPSAPPGKFDLLGGRLPRARKPSRLRRVTRFQPSLVAIEERITTKKPRKKLEQEIFTGLEIRPQIAL